MKNNKSMDFVFKIIPFVIAFILESNISNLIGLNRDKIFSVGTGISLVIFVIIYALATIVISVLRDNKPNNKNTSYNSKVNKNTVNKSASNRGTTYKTSTSKKAKSKRR